MNEWYHFEEQVEVSRLEPRTGGGSGRRWSFAIVSLCSPHAQLITVVDGTSVGEKLPSHYSAPSDPFPPACAGQLAAAVDDCRWPCDSLERRNRKEIERKRYGRRERERLSERGSVVGGGKG